MHEKNTKINADNKREDSKERICSFSNTSKYRMYCTFDLVSLVFVVVFFCHFHFLYLPLLPLFLHPSIIFLTLTLTPHSHSFSLLPLIAPLHPLSPTLSSLPLLPLPLQRVFRGSVARSLIAPIRARKRWKLAVNVTLLCKRILKKARYQVIHVYLFINLFIYLLGYYVVVLFFCVQLFIKFLTTSDFFI